MLFQLGLPDSRGAKWVTANDETGSRTSAIPGLTDDLSTGSGNAWLLREERDGTVELIVGQSRRLRAQRADRSDTNGRNSTALPSVDIVPAPIGLDQETSPCDSP